MSLDGPLAGPGSQARDVQAELSDDEAELRSDPSSVLSLLGYEVRTEKAEVDDLAPSSPIAALAVSAVHRNFADQFFVFHHQFW